ncbi:ER degradation-enhancing alpha-mannosidase-like protein 1 [Oopsacas minuta]|uniref:alpha-1,2-Mannosidase n=1 Tax=Oopsacas minuta TaxID=111878 RepID=A0AAV7JSL0_9METZ|nr:ER degradation-enhancing alpha-mannosidase-like protein 1 [Oopsacas minuta]
MPTSTQPNITTHFRPQSESEEFFDFNHFARKMNLNWLLLFFHILLTILLFLLQNINGNSNIYYTLPDVIQEEPELTIDRQTYPQGYSASELKYRPFSESDRLKYRLLSKEMFYHGYDNYMRYAFPLDELNPVECTGRGPDTNNPNNININDVLGNYSLSLLDSLDMLAILGNTSEFKDAINRVINTVSFSHNVTVQVFEASIRVLGALLSSHLLIEDQEKDFGDLRPSGYSGELLILSQQLADKLLPAFDNSFSGLPHPRVNLNGSKPVYRVNTTCAAGAGTLLIEFGILSRLVGDVKYERLARKAMEIILDLRSQVTGLVGNTIDVQSGLWTDQMTGLGAGIDSLYEYIFKSYILFGNHKDLNSFTEQYANVMKYLKRGRPCQTWKPDIEWTPFFANVDMNSGKVINTWVDALSASFPALQVLSGDLREAICSHAFYYTLWRKYDMLPERYDWKSATPTIPFSPLRPEFAESTYMLYQATRNPFYLYVGKDIIDNIQKFAKTRCGYATIHNVLDKSIEDRMESFFLSETTKYLYLLFDKDNILNKKSERYIFSTEGHVYKITQTMRRNAYNYTSRFTTLSTSSTNTNKTHKDQCSHLPIKEFHLPITREGLGQIEAFIKYSPSTP